VAADAAAALFFKKSAPQPLEVAAFSSVAPSFFSPDGAPNNGAEAPAAVVPAAEDPNVNAGFGAVPSSSEAVAPSAFPALFPNVNVADASNFPPSGLIDFPTVVSGAG
jgi:hypothetical protein